MARLALRLLWREWRGGELRLLALALTVAISASCAVGFFADRVDRALQRQAAAFLGADLVLRTARPSPLALRQQAAQRGLDYSEQQRFSSMVSAGEQMLLVRVKAVDDAYPLRGSLQLAQPPAAPFIQRQPPARGSLWAEPRVFEALQVGLQQPLTLGFSQLTLAAQLLHEPDRGGGLFSLRPTLLMHLDDLAATGLIQPGSRVTYRYLFNGEAAALAAFKAWLQPQLQPGERLLEVNEENPSLGSTLRRAERYLNLAGLLAVLMAAVAIGLSARRYSERHFDSAALLRCLGQPQTRIMQLFTLQLLLLGLAAALLGMALGWLAQQGLVALLAGLLRTSLPAAGWGPALSGAATGLLALWAVALPPLLQLARVPPLRVLRRELAPLAPASALSYGLAAGAAVLLLWQGSGDLPLALLLGAGGLAAAALLAALSWGLVQLCARLPGPLAWRLAVKSLLRLPRTCLTQLAAFGLTLAAMALLLVVRTDLLRDWQAQLPDDAPNYFLINIQPWEQQPLGAFLTTHQINHSGLYPMVRGRLSHINDHPADEWLAPQAPGRRAIRRELNLTWSDTLAPDNRIEAGRWWRSEDQGQPRLSLERRLAEDLGVGLGDRLRFTFGERSVDAEIVSLRSLDWGSLRPNFYVIFAPGALDGLPASAITSFYLPAERTPLLRELMNRFPTLTLLEVAPLLANLRAIIAQVSLAVEYLLLFVLAAGVLVLFAGLANSVDARLQEGALLRTLGARSRLLRRILALEFLLLGALAGLLGALLAEGGTLAIYQLLELPPRLHPMLWLLTPPAGMLLLWAAGYAGTRHLLHHSPLRILNRQ